MSESTGKAVMPAINAHLAADLIVEGERWPVFVWTIDHPAGRVLVDTGMIDTRPEVDDMSPTPHPENIPRDVACVINTHLDFDHCGGNRLFPGVPIHVQARELADARSLDDYTIREWVDFDGATYVEHEGEVELLPGIRLLPAPGHTDGHQVVVVETDAGRNVLGGDMGTSFQRARQRHDRGTAARARVRRSDLAHARGRGPESSSPGLSNETSRSAAERRRFSGGVHVPPEGPLAAGSPSVSVVEHGDVGDADDRAFRRL
jgi:N-acyl homoserine lactone hydrolase